MEWGAQHFPLCKVVISFTCPKLPSFISYPHTSFIPQSWLFPSPESFSLEENGGQIPKTQVWCEEKLPAFPALNSLWHEPLRGDLAFKPTYVRCWDQDAFHLDVSAKVCAGPPAVCSDPSVIFLPQGSHSYWNAHSLGCGHFSDGYEPARGPFPVPRCSHLRAFVQAGPSIWNVLPQSPLIKLQSSFKAWCQKHLHQEGSPSLPRWNRFLPGLGFFFPSS